MSKSEVRDVVLVFLVFSVPAVLSFGFISMHDVGYVHTRLIPLLTTHLPPTSVPSAKSICQRQVATLSAIKGQARVARHHQLPH